MGPFLAVIGAAFAQDPPSEPAVVSEEIIVTGQLAIDRARDAVVRQFEALGFRADRRGDGSIVFRGGSTLVRRATLAPDGTLSFGRPVAGLAESPPAPPVMGGDPRMAPTAGGGATVFLFPGDRKVEAAQQRIRDETRDEIDTLVTIQRNTAQEQRLDRLPDRLDRLWTDGIPLEGGTVLDTPEARRRVVLTEWATRADTPEGREVQRTIEAWLAAVVQPSDDPITDAERAEFEARAGRPLPL
jgi:hypothetical protein